MTIKKAMLHIIDMLVLALLFYQYILEVNSSRSKIFLVPFFSPSVPSSSPELKTKVPVHDGVVTTDDVRYFTNETDDISNLEASVLDDPQGIQLWIKLAYRCLNQNEG